MKLHFAPVLRLAAVVVGAAVGSQSAHAAITVSVEAPGVQASTRSGITTEDFNAPGVPTGPLTSLVSSIGTYTAGPSTAITLPADVFGGANNTQYVAVGAQAGGFGSMILSLNAPADYFGMWWSAMDRRNELKFYSGGTGGTLLGTYTIADVAPLVAASGYNGNPNPPPGRYMDAKYAYVNFDGTAGTTFDTIVFTNINSASGFETDNHSVHSVPEPSALAMGAAASVLGLVLARRRGRTA